MQVIPVIDLKGGRVVAAREGQRERYAPLVSRLTEATDPFPVMAALVALLPWPTVYVADLDALMGLGSQAPILWSLAERHPDVEFWFDQGLSGSGPDGPGPLPDNAVAVVGTESLGREDLRRWAASGRDFILSLDFMGDTLLGDGMIEADDWPERVIVMSLSRVGSGRGPDTARLLALRSRHPATRWIAAGGVRDIADLEMLRGLGLHAVLVSSALHRGDIGIDQLGSWTAPEAACPKRPLP